MTEPREWRVPLPYDRPPLTANDRYTWQKTHRIRAKTREQVSWMIVAAHIPSLARVEVELRYAPARRRREDADNLHPTLKPVLDELVAAKIVPDDTPAYVASAQCFIDPPEPARRGSRLTLVVREAR